MNMHRKRAVVVGSGPNGLAAAIALARAGVHVTVFEAANEIGGSTRTEALTLPGFLHDSGAAVLPLGIASPFFRSLPLADHGFRWIHPDVPLAHPLEDGDAVAQLSSVRETMNLLGEDGGAWLRLLSPVMEAWPALLQDALAPALRVPRHPLRMARFGATAMQSASHLARRHFTTHRARALFAGLAAHAAVPLDFAASAGPALVLAAAAHTTGWPIVEGGTQNLASALASLLLELGGEVIVNHRIAALHELPEADAVLLDVAPMQLADMAGDALNPGQRERLRAVIHGPGICKVDWALSAPIPWTAALPRRAGTVHLGGSMEEIEFAENAAWCGDTCQQPYVLVTQPSLFDTSRAPAGRHTAWAYCHVPYGSAEDATDQMEAQVERFAPGFRAVILARHTRTTKDMETWNANLVGGDITGGAMTLGQVLLRQTYTTPAPGVFLCSASTSPGGGVHGMCGWHAAKMAARHMGVGLPSNA